MSRKNLKSKSILTKSIRSYKTNILKDIDYDMCITFLCIHGQCRRGYEYATRNRDTTPSCLKMLNKDFYNYEQTDITDIKQTGSVDPMLRVYYINYLKNQRLKNLLVIGPIFSIVESLTEIDVRLNFLYVEDPELTKINERKYLDALDAPYETTTLHTLYETIPETPIYDNVIIKIKEFYIVSYVPLFGLTKFPSFLLQTIRGLFELRPGGNMYLFSIVGIVHPAMEWLMMVLSNLFEDLKTVRDPMSIMNTNMTFLIECRHLKHALTPKHREIFISILKNKTIPKYNYTLCKFMDYYSTLVLPEDPNIYPLLKAKTKKRGRRELMVLDTINIDMEMKQTPISNTILYELKHMYASLINEMNYTIKKYVKRDGDKITVDPEYIEQATYRRLRTVITYMEQHGIPYNKAYKAYLNTYNTNLLHRIYSYTKPIQYKILKYKKVNIPDIGKVETYPIPELEDLNKLSNMAHIIKMELLSHIKNNKLPHIIRQITDDFARGVAHYINDRWHRLEHPVTNAFCKFWELVTLHPWLMPTREPRIFYVAEAPGQWIYASHLYAKKQGKTIDWIATSLNPSHPENYTRGGFEDSYGFIRKNKARWVWGADETGDITRVDNLLWYQEYVRELDKPLHLITSDAGMDISDPVLIQKLELAQAIMVLGCASLGTHCCIKHFLPYVREVPVTHAANGFFLNLIYLYVLAFEEVHIVKPLTSSQNTDEFYLLGKRFIGFPEVQYEALLSVLQNFEVNTCFIREADLPETFVSQVIEIVDRITRVHMDKDENINLLLTCMIKKDPVIEKRTQCSKLLKPETIKDMQTERFKAWVTEHRFDP